MSSTRHMLPDLTSAHPRPTLSLVVPAYNEVRRLPASLRAMRVHLDAQPDAYEVIVVDDGSADGTAAAAQEIAADWPELSVLRLPRNRGKGAAVRAGMLRATGAYRAFSDADLSTPMDELGGLRAHVHGHCQIAIASRDLPDSLIQVHQPAWRELMGRAYNLLLRLTLLPGIRDTQCGFKVFTDVAAQACFEPLETMRFGFDVEVLLRARRLGFEVAEVPVRWRHIEESRVGSIGAPARCSTTSCDCASGLLGPTGPTLRLSCERTTPVPSARAHCACSIAARPPRPCRRTSHRAAIDPASTATCTAAATASPSSSPRFPRERCSRTSTAVWPTGPTSTRSADAGRPRTGCST